MAGGLGWTGSPPSRLSVLRDIRQNRLQQYRMGVRCVAHAGSPGVDLPATPSGPPCATKPRSGLHAPDLMQHMDKLIHMRACVQTHAHPQPHTPVSRQPQKQQNVPLKLPPSRLNLKQRVVGWTSPQMLP